MSDDAIQSYRDLRVWREAMLLAELAYKHTKQFPRDELFGLTAQVRRAATSIPANIAEEYGRESTGNYIHFLKIAQGSCKEVETHVLFAERVLDDVGSSKDLLSQCDMVGKMLHGLIRSLQ